MKYKIYWWQAPVTIGWNNKYGIKWIEGTERQRRRHAIIDEEQAIYLKLKYPNLKLDPINEV